MLLRQELVYSPRSCSLVIGLCDETRRFETLARWLLRSIKPRSWRSRTRLDGAAYGSIPGRPSAPVHLPSALFAPPLFSLRILLAILLGPMLQAQSPCAGHLPNSSWCTNRHPGEVREYSTARRLLSVGTSRTGACGRVTNAKGARHECVDMACPSLTRLG